MASRVIPYSPISFVNDETVTQLVRKVVGGPAPDGWYAIQWLNFFGAYVSLCALAIQTSFGAESVLWWFGMYWVPVAWLMAWMLAISSSVVPSTQLTNSK